MAEITAIKITSKGYKVTYNENGDTKTLVSEQKPKDEFTGALVLTGKILCNHLQLKDQEKYISCTGLETRFNKDGQAEYRIYANMVRPSWDKLKLKLNTGFMKEVEDPELFQTEDASNYPYLLTEDEVETLDNMLERAADYLEGERVVEEPDLPGIDDGAPEEDVYEEPSYVKGW